MSEIALAKINSFAHVAQQADVQPSEPIFVLSSSQLQEIISQGVNEATKSLNSRLNTLESTIAQQSEKIKALETTQTLQGETQFIQARLIKKVHTQPKQKDNAEILKALIKANGGKMLSRDARKKMHMSRSAFSQLLSTLKLDIETKPYYLHKNWKVLILE